MAFSIKTTVHDRVDIEEKDATDDENRNWIELKVYHNEVFHDPKATLNQDLCAAIEKAYKQYGLQEPVFEEFGDGIKATVYRLQATKTSGKRKK
ncbi:hypothetical protein [Butyrivibrio sp. VCD2006]|uniref:hypothetical protein n=1 Tax=Butyrivibrio sp. VCD2006 TaxID=1280664 RepID=UPI00040F853C|nr:hypothetical protein [Butyrivibrio sp. VCD2006]